MQKHENDKNVYGHFFYNNLEVVTISNPDTDTSSCVMAVGTGGMNDPIEYPGMAHFLEHMLFMGTEKYPIENEFDSFLSLHNGFSNAYTSSDITLYYFKIDPKYFKKAVDMFSQFFVSPLFCKNSIEREVLAVDSEFKNRFNNDRIRMSRIATIGLDGKDSKFTTGNKNTLDKENIREEMIKFYKNNYNKSRMVFIIQGKESSEELKEYVIESFKDLKINFIKQKNKREKLTNLNPRKNYKDIKEIPKFFSMKPLTNLDEIHIIINLPPEHKLPLNVFNYFEFLFLKESKGSLINNLKSKSLISELQCEMETDIRRTIFKIIIKPLNIPEGQPMYLLQEISEGIKNLKNDIKNYKFIIEKEYKYKDIENPLDLAVDIAERLIGNVEIEYLLCKDKIFDITEEYLDYIKEYMADPKNWIVIRADYKTGEYKNKEEYYKIEYNIEDLKIKEYKPKKAEDKTIENLEILNFNDKFKELRNEIIKNLENEIFQDKKDYYTETVVDSGELKFFFNSSYKTLKSEVNILFIMESSIFELMSVEIIEENFVEEYDDILILNNILISYDKKTNGIEFTFSGFNVLNVIKLFFEYFFTKIKQNLNEDKFYNLVKENTKNSLTLEKGGSCYPDLMRGMKKIYDKSYKLPSEWLEIINDKIHFNRINYIKLMVVGNCREGEVKNLFYNLLDNIKNYNDKDINNNINNFYNKKEDKVELNFNSSDERILNRKIQIYNLPTEDKKNNGCGIFLRAKTIYDFFKLKFYLQVSEDLFFNQLRTLESFGYIVKCGTTSFNDNLFLCFLVVSEKDCLTIKERIIKYLNSLDENLLKSDFNSIKETIINHYKEKLNNIQEFSDFFWKLNLNDNFHIKYKERAIKYIERLNIEDINIKEMIDEITIVNAFKENI